MSRVEAIEALLARAQRDFGTRRRVARIDPESCIGCTRCLQACPVDAIIGAARRMHTVLADLCIGCELCVAPCPVDCIAMAAPVSTLPWSDDDERRARARHEARGARLARRAADEAARVKRATIERALRRARERAAAHAGTVSEPR